MSRPTIVVLCGSTRFLGAFTKANRDETLIGKIVLSVGCFGHHEAMDMGGPTKAMLDNLHLRKIDLADEVLVLNVETIVCGLCGKPTQLFTEAFAETSCCRSKDLKIRPYIGDSTRREIVYAESQGKPIRYLNTPTT